jgi:hypothetical protein
MRRRVTQDLEGAQGEPLGIEEAGEPPRLVVNRLADRIGVGRPTIADSAFVWARSSDNARFGRIDRSIGEPRASVSSDRCAQRRASGVPGLKAVG